MELSPKQQTSELIKKSNSILIVGKKNPDGDTLGSILAFSSVLTSLGKEVFAVVTDEVGGKYAFLPQVKELRSELEGSKDFVIKIDIKNSPVEKLSYNVKDGILNIIVSPENQTYSEKDISYARGSYNFDLIIVLDTADVDSIDKAYDSLTDLFFEKPVVNIDHHSGNEYFGTVNLVDITATSTAEILVSIIEALGTGLLTEEIATNLLAGIIYDTGSFKKKNTTPKSLTVAAQLLAAGAKQQEIIDNFYKTKPLSTLKLWGKILSGLVFDETARFVWTKVSHKDFLDSEMDLVEVQDIMNELLSNTPGADVVLLLIEDRPGKISGKLKGQRGADVLKLAEIFGGTGQFHSAYFDVSNISFDEAEEAIVKLIIKTIKSRLGVEEDVVQNKRIFVPMQTLDKEKLLERTEAKAQKEDEEITFVDDDENPVNSMMDQEYEKAIVEEIKGLVEKEITETKENSDSIAKAIESLDKTIEKKKETLPEKSKDFTPIGDIFKDRVKPERKIDNSVFYDEDEEIVESASEITFIDDDKPEEDRDIRTWKDS